MKFEISDESVLMLSGVGVATVAGFALLAPREHHNVFFAKASGEVPPGPKARLASLHAARQKTACSLRGLSGGSALLSADILLVAARCEQAVCPPAPLLRRTSRTTRR